MQVQPYLNFNGRADEAIEFYRGALGAEVQALMRFKDNPEPAGCVGPDGKPQAMPAALLQKVMHAELRIGETVIMLTDGRMGGSPSSFQGIDLALSPATDAEAAKLFEALAQGGRVDMPLTKTFFSSSFGMLADRFGVGWMIVVVPAGT